MKTCRTCGTVFEPKAWQLRKRDFQCPGCCRARLAALQAPSKSAEYFRDYYRLRGHATFKAYHERHRRDPLYQLKKRARRLVASAIRAGRLVRQPCEACGATRVDAHHDDYNQPLVVRWFCRRCHCVVERSLSL